MSFKNDKNVLNYLHSTDKSPESSRWGYISLDNKAGCSALHRTTAPSSLGLALSGRVILLTVTKVPLREPLNPFSDTSEIY